MASTYEANGGTVFRYNADFSGDVTLRLGGHELVVPAEELLEFVAYCYVAPKKIERIEQSDWPTLLAPLESEPLRHRPY